MTPNIPDFSSVKVLICGDVILDKYWYGSTTRISPEAPVQIVHVNNVEERLGGAGNVALNIRALGGQATLIALAGEDKNATILRELLDQQGIAHKLQIVPGTPTITKFRVISHHQQLIRLDFEGGFSDHDATRLLDDFISQLTASDIVVLSDYVKGTLENVSRLINLARNAKKTILVDPKNTDFNRYRGATLLTPNRMEYEAVVGYCSCDQVLVERGIRLIEDIDLDALLVTRGDEGMTLISKGHAPQHFPTQIKEVYDVTGAGDTVIATLAVGLSAGMPLPEAVALSNLAAGVVVGKLGTATVTVNELANQLFEEQTTPRGILNEKEARNAVAKCRARGKKVVMTYGFFDILSADDVTHLKRVKQAR